VAEKEYIIPYSEDSRKRHYHKTVRGKVLKFVVLSMRGAGGRLFVMIVPMVMPTGILIICGASI
jgi:hypothetical protein